MHDLSLKRTAANDRRGGFTSLPSRERCAAAGARRSRRVSVRTPETDRESNFPRAAVCPIWKRRSEFPGRWDYSIAENWRTQARCERISSRADFGLTCQTGSVRINRLVARFLIQSSDHSPASNADRSRRISDVRFGLVKRRRKRAERVGGSMVNRRCGRRRRRAFVRS